MSLRLADEVYSMDGFGACVTGPEIHPHGKPHHHEIPCGDSYMVAPGARLEVGPHGKLYETMGDLEDEVHDAINNFKYVSSEQLKSLVARTTDAVAKKPSQAGNKLLSQLKDEAARRKSAWLEKNKTLVMVGGAVLVTWLVFR